MTDYTFDPFFASLGGNWYLDDPLLQRLLAAGGADRTGLEAWGAECAGPLAELAEASAQPEAAPRLRHYDARRHRVDEILLPAATREALDRVLGTAGMGMVRNDVIRYTTRLYLCLQNGEAGVACSVACTDGLVRVLQRYGDHPLHREALEQVQRSSPGALTHAAQFVTEIHGGSDAGAAQLEARPSGDHWTLHGLKWFCSNINADWFLVTGRPIGADPGPAGVALFLVPAWRDAARTERNGYTIDRLKDKLGTRELATAEVTFDGATAVPVGPLDRGLATVVGSVLVTSRVHCVAFAAAALRQAERIAHVYAGFRTAFGTTLAGFPLVGDTLAEISRWRARALEALFRLVRLRQSAERLGSRSGEALDFRILLGLCKPVLTREATRLLHDAMLILGANGVEERFTPLPRLWRDAIVMETWEGPHNVLFTQALRDMKRFELDPAGFIRRVTGTAPEALVEEARTILRTNDVAAASVPFARWAGELLKGLRTED